MYRHGLEHLKIGPAMRLAIFLAVLAVCTAEPASADVRHPSFPEAFRGTWARIGDQCADESTPRLLITENRVTGPSGECTVDYVVERAGPRGAIFSGRGSCVDRARPPKKSTLNLLIEPRSDGTTWIGQTFGALAQFHLCGTAP